MRALFLFLIVCFTILFSSCRKDFVFEPSTTGMLKFSKDTVYLDTVFTNIGSSTYTLKVYNKSSKDIKIPIIQLGKGQNSKYRITVDGMTGDNNRVFHNVELLAKDSLYIFIETTASVADSNPTNFLYTDQIKFGTDSDYQKVELVTLIQDAIFLYPQKFDNGTTETLPIGNDQIYGFYLDENDHNNEYIWTNTKPYVIYGYAGVPSGKTLNVNPGARVFFHSNSGIIVGNGGSIKINGGLSTTAALENQVVFEGDRLEPEFEDTPGQWGTIWLTQGSTNNQISNCTIKNANVGLYVTGNTNTSNPNADLKLYNTQIYNCSNYGILSYTGYIDAKNTVLNYCGQYSLAAAYGGKYNFTHCTINNNWNSSKQLAVLVNDYIKADDGTISNLPLAANFTNCIIYGTNTNEISLEQKGTNFSSIFQNCLVKLNVNSNSTISSNPLYDSIRLQQNGNIINANPKYKNEAKNQLEIQEGSSAINMGLNLSPNFNDLLNFPRPTPPNSNPDIGAYQFH